jgi:dihydropteroate synthase
MSGAAVRGFAEIGRTRVVGVLNVTPDSFSDGGEFLDAQRAVAHGLAMASDGADLVDVGGESTRPGAERIPVDIELARVLPVVSSLAAAGVAVSIDTTRAEVARRALDAGASVVNDVSGGTADREMYGVIAQLGVPYILMHSRGPSAQMTSCATYGDIAQDVADELRIRYEAALAAGVDAEQIVLDPGIGFHKVGAQNWPLLAQLDRLAALGRPLLVGTSRKSFLGSLLADADGSPRPPAERDDATHATTALLAAAGVWAVRVHQVGPSLDAVRVAAAWNAARASGARVGNGGGGSV